jgi:hypothetical protein
MALSEPAELEVPPRSEPPADGPSLWLFAAGTLVLYAMYGFGLYKLFALMF